VEKHVVRPLVLADRQLERLVGLAVVDGDRHATVGGVPEEADVDAVADAAVELAGTRRRRAVGHVRISRATILDVWIDHVLAPLSIA
jgi:hypothetical protein